MRELLAQVPFRGTIRERTVEPYLRLLRDLRGRRRVKGVLLDLSSPGGEVVASTDLFLAVQRLNAVKPVYASVGAVAASGGYHVALGARKIFAYPESQIGSIGVLYPHLAARDLVRRLGLSLELVHAGEHKDAFFGYRPFTDAERAKVQSIVQDDYEAFVATVAGARRRPVEEIRALATGEFWSGTRALALGLVDAIADRETALEELAASVGVPSRKTVRVTPPRPWLERVFTGGAAAFTGAFSSRLREAVEDTLLELGSAGARR